MVSNLFALWVSIINGKAEKAHQQYDIAKEHWTGNQEKNMRGRAA